MSKEFASIEQNGMKDEATGLARAVVAALEQVPEPLIPADFAARLAQKAATLPKPSPLRQTQYGRRIACIATAGLLVALFGLTPYAKPSVTNAGFLAEIVVVLELCALAYWLLRSGREMY